MSYRAVIFDLGGVVFPSPFEGFATYEREHGLPDRFIRTVVAASADHGAWARLERNEIDFRRFCTDFEAECAASGGRVDAAELMTRIGAGFQPRPAMVGALRAIRAAGLKTAALTNNWAADTTAAGGGAGPADTGTNGTDGSRPHALGELGVFDVVVESSIEGLRKPDPRIYELVCERLGVEPPEAVFLDDLGVNLKPARALGMTTIKVDAPDAALAELARVLDLDLGLGP